MYPVYKLGNNCTSIMSLFFLSISNRPSKFSAGGFILLFRLDAWNSRNRIYLFVPVWLTGFTILGFLAQLSESSDKSVEKGNYKCPTC
jgi:hypothetical protein